MAGFTIEPTAKANFTIDPPAKQPETPVSKWADKVATKPGIGQELWQGATFGFGDEIDAGAAAAGAALANATLDMSAGKQNFTAKEAYDAVLSKERKNLADYEKENPVSSTIGQITGGLLTGGPGKDVLETGSGLVRRFGKSVATGTAFGGASGFGSGSGDWKNRVADAVWGAGGGALLGGALHGASELAGPTARLGKWLGNIYSTAVKHVSGKTPEQIAATATPKQQKMYEDMAVEYVRRLIEKSGKTASSIADDPAFKMGKPVTTAEAIGRVAMNHLATIARREGESPDMVESMFRQRMEAAPNRIQADLGNAAGVNPDLVQGNFDKAIDALRKKASPLYDKAYAENPPELAESHVLRELAARPSVKKALARAREIAAEEGEDPDSVAVGVKHVRHISSLKDADGKPIVHDVPTEFEIRNPTMKTWDYVKRGLQTVLSREHQDSFGRPILDDASRPVQGTLKELRQELFRISPKYQEAVAHGGEPLQLKEAYEMAPKLMGASTSDHDFSKIVSRYTPSQMEALKGGWVNSVHDQISNGRLKLKDLRTPDFRKKANILLGVSNAEKFISAVEQEQRLTANARRIMPGQQSITGELMFSGKEADEMSNIFHKGAIRAIQRGPKTAVMDMAADLWFHLADAAKTSGDIGVRNELGKLLAKRPDEVMAILSAPMNPANQKLYGKALRALGATAYTRSLLPALVGAAAHKQQNEMAQP